VRLVPGAWVVVQRRPLEVPQVIVRDVWNLKERLFVPQNTPALVIATEAFNPQTPFESTWVTCLWANGLFKIDSAHVSVVWSPVKKRR
jgi:hypothetical protein